MLHITVSQVKNLAEELGYPSHPSILELQHLADLMDVSYGQISNIWDSENIGERLNTVRAIKERDKKKDPWRQCVRCRKAMVKIQAKYCPSCLCEVRREQNAEYRRRCKEREA